MAQTVKNLQHERPGFDPWVEKIPGEGNGYPFHYSCLENPMHRGAWWSTVHRVTKSWTWLKQMSTYAHANEVTVYVVIYEFYGFKSYIQVFNSF